MTLIYSSKTQHRFDNTDKPVFTIAEQGSYPKLFVRDYFYREMATSDYTWNPPNRTDYSVPVEVRDCFLSSWSVSSGVSNSSNNFTKNATEGFSGATADSIGSGNCSIEGKPGWIYGSTAFALQSGTSSYDYYNSSGDIEHALIFNQSPDGITGVGFIRERGIEKKRFKWVIGDSGLIELKDGIIRYYQIKSDGAMILLRSKRSLLSYPVTPTVVLYHVGAIAQTVRIWAGSGAATVLDLFGVLSDFQDWQNQAGWESLAEKTMNKDKTEDFTYFTDLKNLMTLSLNINWDEGEKYRDFLEFFRWHDLSREFIFSDAARNIEFFAKFVSSFKDNPLGADIYGMSVDIRQILNPPILTV